MRPTPALRRLPPFVYRRRHQRLFSSSALSLQSIDCHAGGEPARVVVRGLPEIPGEDMFAKRKYCMDHLDHIRKLLLLEPRGYPCQNANFIVPPTDPEASFGYIILEQNEIYPLMSGHNTICVATALLETGMVPMEEPLTSFKLEAPGGLVGIKAQCSDGMAQVIEIENYPSFVAHHDVTVDVPEIGPVNVSIAYGGMWFCIVDAASVGLRLLPEEGKDIVRKGEMIKVATREQWPVNHPTFDYPGVDILAFTAPPTHPDASSRNSVVMSNGVLDWSRPESWTGMIDRSPCGTGTCAIMALRHAEGKLALDQPFIHESVIGTQFIGKLIGKTKVGDYDAVIPTISGRAWITSKTEVILHPSDPLPEGYTVGDIWAN
uniref:Proline racemase n=1 Tax=Lotharella oceanica TaxID=641309 RepID=A0A7S2TLY8_9EUKA|mmetsp:Transcript_20371/g.38345  ORF Transcript_20371/g.38345 Transcript_20371/m.38345 type:complete len:376 (+) Transcript_20371:92-1219(+)